MNMILTVLGHSVDVRWNTGDMAFSGLDEALEYHATERVHDMLLNDFTEGELYTYVYPSQVSEEGVDVRGWWKIV